MRKICLKCGNERELEDFLKDRSKKDGRRSWCKFCKRESDRFSYRKDLKLSRMNGRSRSKVMYYSDRYHEAYLMESKLRREIKVGRFPVPKVCSMKDETCSGRLEYAHVDYSSWDNVIALCKSHHIRFDQDPKTLKEVNRAK